MKKKRNDRRTNFYLTLTRPSRVVLQEKTAAGRMWWAPQSHSQPEAPREPSPAPAGGGSTAASESQPYRCARRCGGSPWWCACAPPGRGPPSWPSWPSSSLTPPSPSPGLPPPGTASSSPSITLAICARVQRGRRPDRDSGENYEYHFYDLLWGGGGYNARQDVLSRPHYIYGRGSRHLQFNLIGQLLIYLTSCW